MTQALRLEYEVIRDCKKREASGEWNHTSVAELLNRVRENLPNSQDKDLVAAILRLHSDKRIRLKKWSQITGGLRDYEGEQDHRKFFYSEGGDGSTIMICMTPMGRKYYEELDQFFGESQPKAAKIGFV